MARSDTESDDDATEMTTPAPIFRRGLPRQSSSLARLSTAIRRSLRLPARGSRYSRDQERTDDGKERLGPVKFGLSIDSPADLFTQHSPLRAAVCPDCPSRLDDIKDNKRIGRQEKVKKSVRKADWPAEHEVRRELWKALAQGKDWDSSRHLYDGEIEGLPKGGRARQPAFLSEEGAVLNSFQLNEDGTVRLMRLLAVVERMRPDIGSAPMLYPLCALLLHYMDEASAFATVQQLLAEKSKYLMTSPVEWAAAPHTVLALVRKHKPATWKLLQRKTGARDEAEIVETMRGWLSWLFSGLPFSHVVRVLDCFLVEGHKFLIRAGIAVVYVWSKQMKSVDSSWEGKSKEERIEAVKGEIAAVAREMHQISTDTFIETCVRIKNLKSSTITRLQHQFEKEVRDEVTRKQSQKREGQSVRKQLFTQAFSSTIVDVEAAGEIMSALPARLQLATPTLLFRLSQDGASFTHLWSRIEQADQTLLLIRSTDGESFGAYCSSAWSERNDRRERTKSKYFGTGESFVWRLDPELQLPIVYGWVGARSDSPDQCPQMFQTANDRLLVVGSGGGDAVRISEELTCGMSSACSTFASPALVKTGAFNIHELEVFEVES